MQKNFFKYFSIVFLLAMFMFPQNSFAQLTGTKTIPGDYATITAAVTDLNAQGVGSGGVIFNVAAGHTESSSADITITATGTSGNAIVFQKSGAGANPLITRTDAGTISTSTLGGLGDAIIRFDGTDYITFDGIDVTASDQGIEYGYLTHKPDGTNGCQFVTIKNAIVTMTKGTSGYVVGMYIGNGASTASSATGVTVTAVSGINSDITITGNTIQNVHAGIVCRGSSASGFSDNNVIIGQSGAGNTIQNFGAGSATSSYGVYFIYVSNPSVAFNTITSADHGATLYGIFFSSGITGDVVASNNAFTLANIAASSGTQYIYSSNVVTSYTFNNNTFAAGTISSTGTVYLIYASSATPDVTVSGNATVGTITKAGGTTYCYYNFGSPSSGTETITNNNFSNITVTSGSSTFAGIYTNTAVGQNRVTSNNTVSNLNHLGTGITYGIYTLSTTSNQVNDNNVFDITTGGTAYGLYFSGTNPTVYNNNVYNLTTSGTSMYGLYNSGTGTTNCYKNQVYNLTNNNASATLYGFYITTGTSNSVYNNFVSDLKAPNSASLTGLVGMYVSGGTAIGLYYNTIFLNATSVGANFSASGIYASTTPTVDLRNNIVVNSSTPNGTGLAMAYRRSSTTLTSYSANSNNNSFYAGTPSATNVIYYDGTNSAQTIAEFKTIVSPRDAASFAENVPFINSTTAPFNLHVNTGTATQTESGGTPVTSPVAVTDDFDGNTRNVSTPDVGADEFAGIGLDLSSPIISYTALGPTNSTSARTLVVNITDASGVPTTAPGWPNLYWRINAGIWTAATPTGVVGSDYTFSFGAGVAVNDLVEYYVVAQDLAGTPNVGAFPSAGAGGFTANPPAAATAPTTPSSYLIVGAPLAGDYTVGNLLFNRVTGKNIIFERSVQTVTKEVDVLVPQVEQTFEKGQEPKVFPSEASDKMKSVKQMIQVEEVVWTPMENGIPYTGDLYVKKSENPGLSFPDGVEGVYATITAAVNDLNLRGVGGATSFSLTDPTYTAETFPITINVIAAGLPTAANTVTIKPNTGVTASVSGAGVSTALFIIRNSYVTIDGSNAGGTDRSLTIENTSTTGPSVMRILSSGTTPVTNVTVKNCNIINGATTSTAFTMYDVGAAAGGYFNNITIQNNSIQKAYFALYCWAATAAGNGSGTLITGNDLNGSGANALLGYGVYVQGFDGVTVSNNNIANITQTGYTHFPTGIWFATGTTNGTISGNTISDLSYTGTSSYAPRGIAVSSSVLAANVTISDNTISGITTSGSTATQGIYAFGTLTEGVNILRNRISNVKNTNSGGYSAIGLALGTTSTTANFTAANNFIWDVAGYGWTSTSTDNGYGINILSGGGYNLYYNSVHIATNQTTLTGNPAALIISSTVTTAASLDIRDNIFSITSANGTNRFAVLCNAANTVFSNINYNDYYSTGPNLGYIGAANQVDLAAWQTATAQDVNSISGDPGFVSNADLHIQTTSNTVSNNGFYLASVPADIDGNTRSLTTPDIGADEYTYAPPAVLDPTAVTASAVSGSQINVAFTPNVANNNVVIVWNTTGTFTVPAGAPPAVGQPFADGTLLYNGLTSPQNHTGLTQNTTYYYKLFSYNGSAYSPGESAQATTPFGLPFVQDFNAGTTIPAGWSTNFSVSATHGAGGTNGLYRNLYSSATTGFVTSPYMGAVTASTSLTFDYRIVNWSGYPATATALDLDYINVQVSTDNTNWTTLFTIDSSNHVTTTAFANKQVSLSAYSGSLVYVKFDCFWAAGDYYIDFDNVYVGSPLPVNPGTFSASAVSTSQINLAFTTNPSTDNVVIVWNGTGTFTVPTGAPPAAGQPFAGGTLLSNGTVSPVNHTGLSPLTQYFYKAFSYDGVEYSTGVIANATTQAPPITSFPFVETFEAASTTRPAWTQIQEAGVGLWTYAAGSSGGLITAAYEGLLNARFVSVSGTSSPITKLVSPIMDLTSLTAPSVKFYYAQENWFGDQNELKVYYRISASDPWVQLTHYTTDTPAWTEVTVSLPNKTATYQIAFEGINNYGRANVVDLVTVGEGPSNDIGVVAFNNGTGTFKEQIVSSGFSREREDKYKNERVSNSQDVSIKIIAQESMNTEAAAEFKAVVQNFGSVVENSYQVGWRIDGITQTSVSNTLPLNPGATDTLTLTWAVATAGVHTAKAWSILASDTNPNNDSSDVISFFVAPDNAVFVENFEGAFPPAGWLDIDADGSGISWFAGNSTVFPAYVGSGYAGSNYQGANTSNVIDQWLITPNTGGLVAEDIDSLVFWMRSPDGSIWPDSVEIRVSTTGTNTTDFTTLLAFIEVPISGWTRYAFALPNSANRYIAFRYLIYDALTNSNYIGLDLVQILRHATTTTFPLSVTVNNGWNMVSVPGLHPVNQEVLTWWSGKDPAAGVFRFSGGYLPVTTTTPGQGYWMKHVGVNTYNTGDEWPAGGIQIVAHDPIVGATGWNLFGGYEQDVLTSGITTTPGGLQTGQVFGYSAGYTPATNLVPGYGYWIKLTGPGSINIPSLLFTGPAKIVETKKDDWGKIVITDASGKSYTLYTVKGEVNLDNFELPPSPPAGMFDVRFGSGRYAEELSAANKSIELNSLEYPVKVRVENASIKLQDETGKIVNERMKAGEEVVISSNMINKLLVSANIIPDVYALEQNYPNPFNPSTKIEFSLPEDVNNVTLTIYNALGQRVAELVNSKMEAGKYSYLWNAGNVATGMYIYELRTDKFVSVKKMMLLK